VHCRNAGEDVFARLKTWAMRARRATGDRPLGVLHYFSGSPEEACAYVELGFLISVHTSVTHPKAFQLRQVALETPLESLVIETDSPYGAPQSVRGERNEPAYVVEAASRIAAIKGLTTDDVARTTSANAVRLFGFQLPNTIPLIGARV
jgi:TatD DNase family protein